MSLRKWVLYAGCGLLFGAIALWLRTKSPFSAYLAFWGVLCVGGTAIERWRYKPQQDTGLNPNWVATEERFIDPETGLLMQVYFDPESGSRRYLQVAKT